MALVLRQSTAVDVLIGPFVDLTDAATAETGESPSVKLSKNGQTMAAKNDATTPVHDADGYYNCELDATDTNTVGTLVLTVAASANALPVRHEYQVIEEAIYDGIFAASAARVPADATAISGDTAAADNAESFFDGTGYAGTNNVIPSVTTVTGNVNGSVGSVTGAVGSVTAQVTADMTAISGDATAANNAEAFFDGTGYAGTNNVIPSVTTVTGNVNGSVASVTGAVGSVTGNVGGTVNELATQAKADVNAEVVDALNTDTYSEPGQGTPAATASLASKIGYLYKAWRNRSTQNATTYSLYNDDATTVDQKATVSDDGTTADKGEVATGP